MPTDPEQVAAYRRAAIGLGLDPAFFLNRVKPFSVAEMSDLTGYDPDTIRGAVDAGDLLPVVQKPPRGRIKVPVKTAVTYANLIVHAEPQSVERIGPEAGKSGSERRAARQ